jgi:hypothetical protein
VPKKNPVRQTDSLYSSTYFFTPPRSEHTHCLQLEIAVESLTFAVRIPGLAEEEANLKEEVSVGEYGIRGQIE